MIEVTAAVIRRRENGKAQFLICRRPPEKSQGLLWEFPGGKTEPGETAEACVVRECREELAVTLRVLRELPDVTQVYPEKTVHIRFFLAEPAEGEPSCLEHAALAWVRPERLKNYVFCPADRQFLDLADDLKTAE